MSNTWNNSTHTARQARALKAFKAVDVEKEKFSKFLFNSDLTIARFEITFFPYFGKCEKFAVEFLAKTIKISHRLYAMYD